MNLKQCYQTYRWIVMDFVLNLSENRFSIRYTALKYCSITPRFGNFKLNNFRVKGFRTWIYIFDMPNEPSLERSHAYVSSSDSPLTAGCILCAVLSCVIIPIVCAVLFVACWILMLIFLFQCYELISKYLLPLLCISIPVLHQVTPLQLILLNER
jgi:hypothetical protein